MIKINNGEFVTTGNNKYFVFNYKMYLVTSAEYLKLLPLDKTNRLNEFQEFYRSR